MPELPQAAIETEIDELLAGSHTDGISFVLQRAIAACALFVPDDEAARMLHVTEGTVRGQVARAEAAVFAFLEVKRDRTHLGRWALFHWECCLDAAAKRLRAGTLFDLQFDGRSWASRTFFARIHGGLRSGAPTNAQSEHATQVLSWVPLRPSLVATAVVLAWALLALGGVHALISRDAAPEERSAERARASGGTDAFAITPLEMPVRSEVSATYAPVERPILPSVTYEEVEAAIGAHLACADANGFIIHPWPGAGLRLTRPFLTIPGTADREDEEQGEAVRAAHKTLTECQREYLDDALTAWNAQMEPTDEERLEIHAFMKQCVAEGGRPGTERPAGMGYSGGFTSGPQLDFLIRADQLAMWADCAWALETETGFRAPGPPGGG